MLTLPKIIFHISFYFQVIYLIALKETFYTRLKIIIDNRLENKEFLNLETIKEVLKFVQLGNILKCSIGQKKCYA